MKKKILLTLLMLTVSILIFSVSAGAATLQEAVDTYEGYFDDKIVEKIDGIEASEHINTQIFENYGATAVNARVELSCICGKTHTYPTYYVTRFHANDWSHYYEGTTFKGTEVFHIDFTDINSKNSCGASYDKHSVIAIEIPDGYKVLDGGNEKEGNALYMHGLRDSTSLKFVDMTTCSTLVDLDDTSFHEAFGDCPALEYVKLADSITEIGGWAFENCSSLKRVVISENSQLKKIGTRSFVGCTSLEAFYLPDGFTMLNGSNKSDYGSFTGCSSLYFVNEPNELTKPDVYYFPESLNYIEHETVKNCPNLNSVLVFGENITKIDTQWVFATNSNSTRNENNPLTLVFKGNMTKFSYSSEQAYTTVIFANANQGSITFNPTGNATDLPTSSFYICANGTRSMIKKSPSFSVDGFVHNAEVKNIGATYTNYFENGNSIHKCFCGCEYVSGDATEPVFEWRGYSVKEDASRGCFVTQGIKVNREALGFLGEDIDFGIVVDVNIDGIAYNPILNGATSVSLMESEYSYFDVKVSGIPEEHAETAIVFCGYVRVGDTVSYLDGGKTCDAVVGISYNDILNKEEQ